MKIENNHLSITVATAGAELSSIFHKKRNQEFLWQGSADWWPRRAPVLFPVVGKLNQNTYRSDGKEYSLPQHGFARDNEFALNQHTSNSLSFVLKSNPELFKKYPFEFELVISYTLKDATLVVRYEVKNPGTVDLPFSIGAHPGFALQPGEVLSDYTIEFDQTETLDRHLITEGLFSGQTERVVSAARSFDLTDDQMKKDAIVFKDMKSQTLVLKSRRSDYRLKFHASGFPYFGIWAKPGGPFVCLEPWCGLADNTGFTGDLKQKEGIELLNPGKELVREFSIEI